MGYKRQQTPAVWYELNWTERNGTIAKVCLHCTCQEMKYQFLIEMCNDIHTRILILIPSVKCARLSVRLPVHPCGSSRTFLFMCVYVRSFIIKCIYLIACSLTPQGFVVVCYLLWILSLPNNYCTRTWRDGRIVFIKFPFAENHHSKVDFTFFPLS